MKNFVFISPNFPLTYWRFCRELRNNGMRVLGISCITNMAAGILDQPLSHAEVTETANRVKGRFRGLLDAVIEKME